MIKLKYILHYKWKIPESNLPIFNKKCLNIWKQTCSLEKGEFHKYITPRLWLKASKKQFKPEVDWKTKWTKILTKNITASH